MIALVENHGYVLSPLTAAPVNEVDMVLLPQGLKALKHLTREAGLEISGAVLNLDAGFDSKANRKSVFNAGLKPNIKENPRNRQTPKRGRKSLSENLKTRPIESILSLSTPFEEERDGSQDLVAHTLACAG